MAANEQWKEFALRKMSEKVDVSTLETEREQLKKHLRQVTGAKAKLTDMQDKLDVSVNIMTASIKTCWTCRIICMIRYLNWRIRLQILIAR